MLYSKAIVILGGQTWQKKAPPDVKSGGEVLEIPFSIFFSA